MLAANLLIFGLFIPILWGLRLPKTYEAIALHCSSTPEDNRIAIDISKLRVLGHEHAVNGTIVVSEDLDDSYKGYLESFVDSSGSGDWKQLPIKIWPIPVCKGVKEYLKKLTYPSLIPGNNTDFPFDGSQCPIRKGTYYIKNMVIDPTNFTDIMPRGFLKAVFHFVKDNQKMGSFELYGQVKDRVF
ncbi:uncharacterized protein Dwil_GK12881 [Drosophila willistoni]|uniref:MD-2-related lipid-recognition domain-containing protein n=1 Tax=Drosophila willistoni TaxID=7260 RepID=B4NJ91_DROWI|nr:uncharacterized protein LOC6651633 [Drosophila willistoni]EDW84922.1 uncharacterized protein Dwil_GK12881 [Drosophila willistoni]